MLSTRDPYLDVGRHEDPERDVWAQCTSWPKKRVEGTWESKQNKQTYCNGKLWCILFLLPFPFEEISVFAWPAFPPLLC